VSVARITERAASRVVRATYFGSRQQGIVQTYPYL